MQVITLSTEEKQKIIAFLQEKENFYKKKINTYNRELNILLEVEATPPKSVSSQWLIEVQDRIATYKARLLNVEKISEDHTKALGELDVIKPIVINEAMRSSLSELYNRERDKKSIDPMYKYYPRLKKAKEAALHVFSNKIKIIMESENVQVA